MSDEFFALVAKARSFERPPAAPQAAEVSSEHRTGIGLGEGAHRAPRLQAFWKQMSEPPFTFLSPRFPSRPAPETAPEFLRGLPLGGVRRRRTLLRRRSPRVEDSRNWSGAFVGPEPFGRIVAVAGRWTVPSAVRPALRPYDAAPEEEYHASIWIGLDGRRGYPNESLPQIGTSLVVDQSDRSPRHTAWYQWWVRGRPAHHRPIEILNFPVSEGDEILASLSVEGNQVRFQLKNRTRGIFTGFEVPVPDDVAPLGSTAEWILERPTKVGARLNYALPDYGTVVFQDCLAVSTVGGADGYVTKDLANAGLIRMYEIFEHPSRTAHVSIPERLDPSRARVTFRAVPDRSGLEVGS